MTGNRWAPAGGPPDASVGWADRRLRPGWLAIAAACLLYLAFLPGTLVNADEYHYAGQAYVLADARFFPTSGDPLPVAKGLEWQSIRFPLGWPLALAAARPFGFRAMYLVPMILHLAAAAAFGRLAVRRGLPAWLNALYLFHPAIWGFSRTLMSDVPAVALAVIAVDAWEEGRSWLPGALLAFGMLLRAGALFTAGGFWLAVLRDLFRPPRRAAALLLPVAAAGAVHLMLNLIVSGDVLSPYMQRGLPLLDGTKMIQHLLLCAAGLSLLPPFPLAVAVADARNVGRWWLGALPVLAFFVPYAYHDESPRLLETLVASQRFVLAAHAFLMIGTLGVWGPLASRFRIPVLVGVFAAALAATLGLDRIRAPYEEAARAVSSCRPGRIGHDYGSGRVVAGIRAKAWRILDGSDPKGQDDLVIVSRMPVTNRLSDPGVRFPYPELDPHRTSCRAVGRFEIYDLVERCPAFGALCRFE